MYIYISYAVCRGANQNCCGMPWQSTAANVAPPSVSVIDTIVEAVEESEEFESEGEILDAITLSTIHTRNDSLGQPSEQTTHL